MTIEPGKHWRIMPTMSEMPPELRMKPKDSRAVGTCDHCGKRRRLNDLMLTHDEPPLIVCTPEAKCSCAP